MSPIGALSRAGRKAAVAARPRRPGQRRPRRPAARFSRARWKTLAEILDALVTLGYGLHCLGSGS